MLTIPEGYKTVLDVYETQRCIEFIKSHFQKDLCAALHLKRVSAPLFVRADTGLNDDLNGVERPEAEFLCAERKADGRRTYKMVKSAPELTSFGLDLYDQIIPAHSRE